jgi:hypothetical protein
VKNQASGLEVVQVRAIEIINRQSVEMFDGMLAV